MNFTEDGLSLWYGTPDAPAPPDEVARGSRPSLTVGVRPSSPSNTVSVLYRVDGGFLQRASATERRIDYDRDIQYFRAAFPPFVTGRLVEYCPVVGCAGRQAPREETAERFPSKFRLAAPRSTIAEPAASNPTRTATGVPRFQPEAEFLCQVLVQFERPQVIGDTPAGIRINYWVRDGSVAGPKLNAKFLPPSSDSFLVRRDGVGIVDVHGTFQTDDGALISVQYGGHAELGEDGYRKALANQFTPYPPAVVAPRFLSGHPKYLWLNRLQCIGVGKVRMQELTFEFDVFAIHPRGPAGSA
jgi:hypothetical protein